MIHGVYKISDIIMVAVGCSLAVFVLFLILCWVTGINPWRKPD